MKKKGMLIVITLIALLTSLFISCSAEMQEPGDEDAYVTFDSGSTAKDLSQTIVTADADDLYWYYTAVKKDNYGQTGETTDETKVGATGVPGLEGTIGPFSQGKWEFTLTAYKKEDRTTLIYRGTSAVVTLSGANTEQSPRLISVSVTPVGDTGTISLDGAYFRWADGGSITDTPNIEFSLYQGEQYNQILGSAYTVKSTTVEGSLNKYYLTNQKINIGGDYNTAIPVGTYKLVAKAYLSDSTDTLAENELYVSVYGNADTQITGDITEGNFSYIQFEQSGINKAETVEIEGSEVSDTITVNVAPVDDSSKQTTEINFSSVLGAESKYNLNVEVSTKDGANGNFQILPSVPEFTEAVASIGITLNKIIDQTSTPETNFEENVVTITTYIAPGFGNKEDLSLVYVNEAGVIVDSAEKAETDSVYHIIESYNNETGMLVIKTNHFSSFYVAVKTDAKVWGFASGNGTKGNPYVIENAEQFKNISKFDTEMRNGYYGYFSVESDLDFSNIEDYGMKVLRGEIDFNNHKIENISSERLIKSNITLIDDIIEGKILNLNYYPDDVLPIAYTCGWTAGAQSSVGTELITVFENVNVYGSFANVANNISLYILQAFAGALEFYDCTNYATITGESYNGLFLGGYPAKNRTTRLVFDHCVYAGVLMNTNYAGFLTGNSAGYIDKVIVKDCEIRGTIKGITGSGAYCGLGLANEDIQALNKKVSSGITGVNNIVTPESTISIVSDSDSFDISDPNASTYKISGQIYTNMRDTENIMEDKGTLLKTFEKTGSIDSGSNVTFPTYQVVDYVFAKDKKNSGSNVREFVDENNNPCVEIDETKYYYVQEEHGIHVDYNVTAVIVDGTGKHVAKNLDVYHIYTYDAGGLLIGYKKVD